MKRWGLLVAFLYGVIFVLLTVPAAIVLMYGKSGMNPPVTPLIDVIDNVFEIFKYFPYWIWLAIMVLCQAIFLLVPVERGRRRPLIRRHVMRPVLVAGFLLGFLVFAAGVSILALLQGDNISPAAFWSVVGAGVAFWIFWAVLFHRLSVAAGRLSTQTDQSRWLFRGSILEMLIAIPTHIYVRQQSHCCADTFTAWGIAAGFSVMLFSFGPGVLILFYDRWKRLQPKTSDGDGENVLPQDETID